jgi:predicted TPR repeat methyltransferase
VPRGSGLAGFDQWLLGPRGLPRLLESVRRRHAGAGGIREERLGVAPLARAACLPQEADALQVTREAQYFLGVGAGEVANFSLESGFVRDTYRISLGTAPDASLQCFKRVLEFEPDNALAQHLLAARTDANVERDPSGYIRSLFDSYAGTFDQHLKGLDYTTPQRLMVEILAARDGATPWDSLDLGCGTGLFGAEIASRSRRLVGVDVSAKMIERARELNLYTELRCTDLLTALESEASESYDVVAAADVFVYVGKLDSIVPAVRNVLRRDGIFAFSAEAAEGATSGEDASNRGYTAGIRGRYYTHAQVPQRACGPP